MDAKTLQSELNRLGADPVLIVDGFIGRKTREAVEAILIKEGMNPALWSDAQQLIAFEQLVYKKDDITVGTVDGLVGELTRYAREVYAARKTGDPKKIVKVEKWRDAAEAKPVAVQLSAKNRTTFPTQAQVRSNQSIFGHSGSNQIVAEMPFPFRIAWEPAKTVQKVTCHKLAAPNFQAIWKAVLDHYGYEEIKRLRLDMFGGCFNDRPIRGGTAKSIHAWGMAWDVDPDRNQLKWGRDKATLDDPIYAKFWEIVRLYGGVGLGPTKNYDWMHFQFASL